MQLLPTWTLTDRHPAFFDCESGSALEATARIYAAMNELIKEYNAFAETANKTIAVYKAANDEDKGLFRQALRQEFQDFIDVVDLKLREMRNEFNDQKEEFNALAKQTIESVKQRVIDYVQFMKDTGEVKELFGDTIISLELKYDALIEEIYEKYDEEVEKINAVTVTPQMFGVDMNNAGAAIQAAIDSGRDVYLPAGEYKVAETLNINTFRHIKGAGAGKTTIRYTGSDALFNITARYESKPIIEGLKLVSNTLSTASTAIRCNSGNWGGSFVLRDFHILGFNGNMLDLKSAFGVIIENGFVQTDGVIDLGTHDGSVTVSNFTNCLNCKDVLFTTIDRTQNPQTLVAIANARDITFNKCQFHFVQNIVIGNNAKDIHFVNCWFENVGAIYNLDATTCDAPTTINCRFVGTSRYNTNASGFDWIAGEDLAYLHNGSNRTHKDILSGDEITYEYKQIFNENDTYKKYFDVYKISTKETFFRMPLNLVKSIVENSGSTYIDLTAIKNYAAVGCLFKAYAVIVYDDDSRIVLEKDIIGLSDDYYPSASRELYRSNWGKASSNSDDVLTSSFSESAPTAYQVSAGKGTETKKQILLFVTYNFLGV